MASIQWPPKLPKNFPMSVRDDGYCKSFGGRVKWVCGKIPPRAAEKRLRERWDELEGTKPKPVRVDRTAEGLTVKTLSNLFCAWLRRRIETKKPKPFSVRTYDDYVLALQLFADTVWTSDQGDRHRLGDLAAVELGPSHFSAFAAKIPGTSPYTTSRYIAAVKAMYSWANENDKITHPVRYGSDFRKPSVEELRMQRADKSKEYSADDVRGLLEEADRLKDVLMTAWVWLCLNAAFTNVDLGKLTRDRIELDAGIVQLVRGKKGRARRKCVLWPETIAALRAYTRPAPLAEADADLFFVTTFGRAYVRQKEHRDAEGTLQRSTRINSAGMEFAKLLDDADVHAEGRSLSGFRTTFRTLAEAMPERDDNAVDLIMGHARKHMSASYVERFPVEKLRAVVQFVWDQLFAGWMCDWPPKKEAASE